MPYSTKCIRYSLYVVMIDSFNDDYDDVNDGYDDDDVNDVNDDVDDDDDNDGRLVVVATMMIMMFCSD